MENHPIETLMTSTMENLRDMIDVNTIIGEPIESKDGTLILPISKVSFGFASGGSEFSKESESEKKEDKYPFGGGSGAGVSVKPVAFLVIRQDSVRLLSVGCHSPYDKMLDNIPPIIELLKDSLGKHNENKKDLSPEEQKS